MATLYSLGSLAEPRSLEHSSAEPRSRDHATTELTCDSPCAGSTPAPSPAAPPSSREDLAKLSNSELLAQLSTLVRQEQVLTAAILEHLAEVERRELHLAKGYPSLFAYCVHHLGFSEDVAYKRVGAARYSRRFPRALELLSQGALHLSALMLVGPHLTDANHREWLTAVAGKSKREVELFVAARCPKPDVPTSVRRLPRRKGPTQAPSNDDGSSRDANNATQTATAGDANASSSNATLLATVGDAEAKPFSTHHPVIVGDADASPSNTTQTATAGELQSGHSSARAAGRPRVQPLSASTFRVVFTASEVLKQKLDRARELCSHTVAPGDLPSLLERAVDLLIEREEKRRYAVRSPRTCKAKSARDTPPAPPPVLLNDQEPDPAEGVEPKKQPPPLDTSVTPNEQPPLPVTQPPPLVTPATPQEQPPLPVASVTTQDEAQEPAASVKTTERARQPLQPSTSVDPETALLACSHNRDQDSIGPFPVHEVHEFTRYVPAAVRRAVWERDGGQCAFVDGEGHRCAARQFLEIDHVDAYARGGATAIGNCRLACRSHNQHWAKLTFGIDFIARARSRAKTR